MEYTRQGLNGIPQFPFEPNYGYDDSMYHNDYLTDWMSGDYSGPFGMIDQNNEYQDRNILWRHRYKNNTKRPGDFAVEPAYGTHDFDRRLHPPETWDPLPGEGQFGVWDTDTGRQAPMGMNYYEEDLGPEFDDDFFRNYMEIYHAPMGGFEAEPMGGMDFGHGFQDPQMGGMNFGNYYQDQHMGWM